MNSYNLHNYNAKEKNVELEKLEEKHLLFKS